MFILCVGIFGRISNKEVVWEERNVSRDSAMDCDNGISFSGVPFLIIGRLMLECCYGSKRVVNSNADHNVCIQYSDFFFTFSQLHIIFLL